VASANDLFWLPEAILSFVEVVFISCLLGHKLSHLCLRNSRTTRFGEAQMCPVCLKAKLNRQEGLVSLIESSTVMSR
jgi:hypothetical protein